MELEALKETEPLRILMMHNRYRVRGGEDESTDAEVSLLRSRGHEVRLLEANNDAVEGVARSALAAVTTTWSRRWARQVDEILSASRYDILHVQNFFPTISPSVYYAAARHRVPVVQSVRNYRLICASANLFRDDRYCDDCVGRGFAWPAIAHRCYRGSLPGSAAVATMQAAHRLLGTWTNKVATYVALTNYVRDRLIEGGFAAEKIVVKPNFVMTPSPEQPAPARDYVLYVGRIHPDKGVDTLLDAWATLQTDLTLKLVGEGEMPPVNAATGTGPVERLGRRPLPEVYELMRGALCLVFPPKWQEPFGRVVVEAYAAGTPVIASRVGALPEMIENGVTGLLFESGSTADLARQMRKMLDGTISAASLGAAAHCVYHEKYSAASNYRRLLLIYQSAISDVIKPPSLADQDVENVLC